ncbi:EAL domain-containing protein [Parapusillimonas granuli]|nr:EAL domain-containing protein [Parapusillimonas granuli]MEB2398569.1 EAL domain-containing protein [Alcaligenaceae bacterium]
MRDLDQKVERLAIEIGLDHRELAERKQFLELTDDDARRLRLVNERLRGHYHRLADAFYDHLTSFDQLRKLLGADEQLARLKHVQSAYFHSLMAGDYGADYVRDRLRVGLVHQRIGIEPKWYLGAYRKYVAEMQRLLWELLGDDPDEFLATCNALIKVVCFDISLALDTYFQADTEEILEHKEYAEQIVATMPSGLMMISENLLILSMNPAMRAMFLMDDDVSGVGMPLFTLVKSSLLQNAAVEALATESGNSGIFVAMQRGAAVVHLNFSLTCIRYRGKKLLLAMAEDVSEKLEARAQLAEIEDRYRMTFDYAAVGLAQTMPDGRLSRVNAKFCEILGYRPEELLGRRMAEFAHPEEKASAHAMVASVLAGKLEGYRRERRYLHKDGHIVWAGVTVSCLMDGGLRMGLVLVLEDISQRKLMEQELAMLACQDPLTQLPNRVLLQDRLAHELRRAEQNGSAVAVMYIDLDRFKNANDSLGHKAGDAVLVEVARRLQALAGAADTVARPGGDEFVMVMPDVATEDGVARRAQAILASLSRVIRFDDGEFYTGASIGIALFPADGDNGEAMLKHADAAMYRAKECGRNNFQFYTEELSARNAQRMYLTNGLRQALDRNEFQLHYQPKLEARSGRVVGVEALIRWFPAGGGMISPAEFIPIAEESGLIIPIGDWVLATACKQAAGWRREGRDGFRVAVNLSAAQLKNRDVVQVVAQALRDADCPADALDLEITESMLMENPEKVSRTLQGLCDLGVRLSIDDFGTGYSSLNYLKSFPIHELKIDQTFIRDIPGEAGHASIVKAIIDLAHSMELIVVAEGVETAEQKAFLERERCDELQGYLFSKPLPAHQLGQLLDSGAIGRAWSGTVS